MNSEKPFLYTTGAISPLDGRYAERLASLRDYCSEYALMQNRVRVEIAWFRLIVKELDDPTDEELKALRSLETVWKNLNMDDIEEIRQIELKTNHDVKAVEYFVKDRVKKAGLEEFKELVHFACTSEDITNVAYALCLNGARDRVLVPRMMELMGVLSDQSESFCATAMLSRTHGQTASPTTLGKEIINFAIRMIGWTERFMEVKPVAKMNGAVGNFNAHVASAPDTDWKTLTRDFLKNLGLVQNNWTTQIEPHDWIAQYLNELVGFNQVLLDLNRDVWSYISLGYFKQRLTEGEVGSSTMPHKVNPIDFENSEGNIGIANATARHLADKLLVSRWQRDLSDSTAMRNLGVVLGHSLIGIESTLKGMRKLEVDQERIESDLEGSWEVLAEPVQTVMRLEFVDEPYEQLKELTRGQQLDESRYLELINELPLEEESRKRLAAFTPKSYTGLARQLAMQGVDFVRAKIVEWTV